MNIIRRFLLARHILRNRKEETFPYRYKYLLKENSSFVASRTKKLGIMRRIVDFFKFILITTSRSTQPNFSQADALAFVTSINQLRSLTPTLDHLNLLGRKFSLLIGNNNVNSDKENICYTSFHISDTIIAFLLFLTHSPSLIYRLRRSHSSSRTLFFDAYCLPYIYLPYFLRLCSNSPKLVIVANDHLPATVSLLEVALVLNIKTAYLQHASVNKSFPPLNAHFAFLDGIKAAKTYSAISLNEKSHTSENNGRTIILLSGQQKKINNSLVVCTPRAGRTAVGLGLSLSDDIELIYRVVHKLDAADIFCKIRTHPRHNPNFIDQLTRRMGSLQKNIIINGGLTDLDSFFVDIFAFLGSDTSLQLEAALCRIPTFYIQLSTRLDRYDSYDFIAEGITMEITAEQLDNNKADIEQLLNSVSDEREDSLKAYSDSYGTRLEGNEGWCVACALNQILSNEEIGYPYERTESVDLFDVTYRLSSK